MTFLIFPFDFLVFSQSWLQHQLLLLPLLLHNLGRFIIAVCVCVCVWQEFNPLGTKRRLQKPYWIYCYFSCSSVAVASLLPMLFCFCYQRPAGKVGTKVATVSAFWFWPPGHISCHCPAIKGGLYSSAVLLCSICCCKSSRSCTKCKQSPSPSKASISPTAAATAGEM